MQLLMSSDSRWWQRHLGRATSHRRDGDLLFLGWYYRHSGLQRGRCDRARGRRHLGLCRAASCAGACCKTPQRRHRLRDLPSLDEGLLLGGSSSPLGIRPPTVVLSRPLHHVCVFGQVRQVFGDVGLFFWFKRDPHGGNQLLGLVQLLALLLQQTHQQLQLVLQRLILLSQEVHDGVLLQDFGDQRFSLVRRRYFPNPLLPQLLVHLDQGKVARFLSSGRSPPPLCSGHHLFRPRVVEGVWPKHLGALQQRRRPSGVVQRPPRELRQETQADVQRARVVLAQD
mmetsp:Transcript_20452/g.51681  ORF Transcript_20452/g.51681 Transcript_20452/m.51681 type:complete len:283 (+) Transcript_20452:592-1440(+)